MDDQRTIARMMALTISVARAKRFFPGIPAPVFYAVAPPADSGRLLTFGEAFEIARQHAEAQATQAILARAAEARAAALAARQVAAALPALDHLAGAIDPQGEALLGSLRARAASERTMQIVSRIGAVNARHANRARARLEQTVQGAFE